MKVVTSTWLGWGEMAPTPVEINAPGSLVGAPAVRGYAI